MKSRNFMQSRRALCGLFWLLTAPLAAQDAATLVKQFEGSLGQGAAEGQAAQKLFQNYSDYKKMVAAGQVNKETARKLDEHLVAMTQQVWRDVAVRNGSGLSYVVPVGTLGDRHNNPAYIPGKSDKDFIPRGSNASQAAKDFTETFQKKFGIPPGSVDVNALDPTNISNWPSRVSAAGNFEKYNTSGGVKWLENQLHQSQPNLWRYDTLTGGVSEVKYGQLVQGEPPKLTSADAAGFFSDNMKFRQHIAEEAGGDLRLLALKQSKYDLRNIEAFRLAGGQLSEADQALLQAADYMRKGMPDAGVVAYMNATKIVDYNDALRAYSEAMNGLTERMATHVINNHVALMAANKGNAALANELAAAIANLPAAQAKEVQTAVTKTLGKAEWNEVSKIAEAFKTQVKIANFGAEYFNEQAMKNFGKSYDKLSDAEKAILHGAGEATEGFASKTLKVAGGTVGLGFAIWSISDAYSEGSKRGTGVALGSAAGRAIIELCQYGYPPAAAAELVARLAAGAVNLGASAYKNDVLDTLYARYKNGGNLDDVLNEMGVQRYNAGGLRQLALEMRAGNDKLSDAQIDAAIRDYFVRRKNLEEVNAKTLARIAQLEAWIAKNDIPLKSGADFISADSDNQQLLKTDPKLYYERLQAMMQNYDRLEAQLKSDGLLVTPQTVYYLLFVLYRGSEADFRKALADIYKQAGKIPPGAATAPPKTIPKMLLIGARDSYLKLQKPIIPPGSISAPGVVLAGGGQFKKNKTAEAPCDPAVNYAAVMLASGGKLRGTIVGTPPVEAVWSMGNSNSGLRVYYEPKLGSGFGKVQMVLELGGQAKDSNLKGDFEIPGPGRVFAQVTPPVGWGVFSGGCFEQAYQMKVELLELKTEQPAQAGQALNYGDVIRTGSRGEAVIALPDGGRVLLKAEAVARLEQMPNGVTRVVVEKGRFRFDRPNGSGAKTEFLVNGKLLKPTGTEFEGEVFGNGINVRVKEGSVAVTSDGKVINVLAGEQLYLNPTRQQKAPYELKYDQGTLLGGLPLRDLVFDDWTTAPSGTITLSYAAGRFAGNWLWEDPGKDAKIQSLPDGALRFTVPDNNDFWDYRNNAPRLLHRVTGDFDLQALVRGDCKGPDASVLHFMVKSPFSFAGYMAGQFQQDDPSAHYWLTGAPWAKTGGKSLLPLLNNESNEAIPVPDKPYFVRMTRRGHIWKDYWSLDGVHWTLYTRQERELPPTVFVGLCFVRQAWDRQTGEAATYEVRDLKLTSGTLTQSPWDAVQATGVAEASDKAAKLILDGTKSSAVALFTAQPQKGDFDFAVRYRLAGWQHQAGQERNFIIFAAGSDNKTFAYIGQNQNDNEGRVMRADLRINGGWGRYRTAKEERDDGLLRVRRSGGIFEVYRWLNSRWTRLDDWTNKVEGPVYLGFTASTKGTPEKPAPLTAEVAIESMASLEGDSATAWQPQNQNEIKEIALPAGTRLPAGVPSAYYQLPFPAGQLFNGANGEAWLLSSDMEPKGRALKIERNGWGSVPILSEAIAGTNAKGAVPLGDGLLVGVDYYPNGGNRFGSYLLEVKPDGSFEEWKSPQQHGGIADMLPAPGGGWYVADFETDGLWHVPAKGEAEKQLIQGAIPPGLFSLAMNPKTGVIYAVNLPGGWPFGGESAIYRIEGGKATLLAKAPDGGQFSGVAWSAGGAFAEGVYVSDGKLGTLARVADDGTPRPVASGLAAPGRMRFEPRSGDLLVSCEGQYLLRLFNGAKPPQATSAPLPGVAAPSIPVAPTVPIAVTPTAPVVPAPVKPTVKPPVVTPATPPGVETILFRNFNVFAVQNKPKRRTLLRLEKACVITEISTYHWNDGKGQPPGTIQLRRDDKDMTIFGPWPATGTAGQGGVPSALWTCKPNIQLPPGTYFIEDSHPESWAQNAATEARGMAEVKGYEK